MLLSAIVEQTQIEADYLYLIEQPTNVDSLTSEINIIMEPPPANMSGMGDTN